MRPIFVLAELAASTASFDPLSLDWNEEQNADLVDKDLTAVESLKAVKVADAASVNKFLSGLLRILAVVHDWEPIASHHTTQAIVELVQI